MSKFYRVIAAANKGFNKAGLELEIGCYRWQFSSQESKGAKGKAARCFDYIVPIETIDGPIHRDTNPPQG